VEAGRLAVREATAVEAVGQPAQERGQARVRATWPALRRRAVDPGTDAIASEEDGDRIEHRPHRGTDL
jgi:hypothetical protein